LCLVAANGDFGLFWVWNTGANRVVETKVQISNVKGAVFALGGWLGSMLLMNGEIDGKRDCSNGERAGSAADL
jgi:hypothetical protein